MEERSAIAKRQMISPSKSRIKISLPNDTIEILDKARGNMTRSEFIDTAIYVLIANASLCEANKKAPTNKKA